MENECLISIVIPVYKTEKVLKRCIDSCLRQSYSNFELLLVDDGSPDACPQICDAYSVKDERIAVFHKKNGGCASAKNWGIEHAKGKYITFVDSDDYIDEDYLYELIQANDDEADMVIAGIKYVNEDTLKAGAELQLERFHFTRNEYEKYLAKLLDQRALNYHVAKLYKKELIDRHNIQFTDFRETGGDDTVFNFDMLDVSTHISVSNKNIYNYIYYSNSTSHQYDANKWKRSRVLDAFLRERFQRWGCYNQNAREVIEKRVVHVAYWVTSEIAKLENISIKERRSLIKNIAKDKPFREAFKYIQKKKDYPKNSFLLYKKRYRGFVMIESGRRSQRISKFYGYAPMWVKKIYRRIKRRARK